MPRNVHRRPDARSALITALAVVASGCLLSVVLGSPQPSPPLAGHTDRGTTSSPAPPTAEFEMDPNTAPAPPAAPTYVEQGAGTLTNVPGNSELLGAGPTKRFIVQTEDGINADGAAFAAAVESTLGDPRGWSAGGMNSFQRIDAGPYDFVVMLVSPLHVENYCPGAGTQGYTSCRYKERVVINLARWETAVPEYQGDLATYRLYVINHEVGHALGHPHEQCPAPGALAPVMQQQTMALNGCLKNGWPHPNG